MNAKRDVPPHGCQVMLSCLEDERVPIHYYAPQRQYAIKVFNGLPEDEGPYPIQLLDYCPWCGAKLPKELGHQWLDDIRALLGDDFHLLLDVEGAIPTAYESDEWWQGRFDWDGNVSARRGPIFRMTAVAIFTALAIVKLRRIGSKEP